MTDLIPIRRELHLRTLGMLSSYVTTLAGIDYPDNDEGDYHQRINENTRAAVNSTIAELRAALAAPVQGEAVEEIVPKWRYDALVQHCKLQDKNIAKLSDERNTAWMYEQREVWFWQGDGEDYPESLSCPVVIKADDLRAILAPPQPADVGELVDALRGMLALDEENHQRCSGDEDVCLEVRKARAALAKFDYK